MAFKRLHKIKRTEKSPFRATFSVSSKHTWRRYLAWEMSLLCFTSQFLWLVIKFLVNLCILFYFVDRVLFLNWNCSYSWESCPLVIN